MVKVIFKKNLPIDAAKAKGTDQKDENENSETATSLGKFLRDARKTKGLNLARLSEMTRIPLWNLKALEEGRYEKLPAEVYLKGVFFRLAKFLELTQADILEKYYEDNPPVPKDIIEKPAEGHHRFGQYLWAITPKKITVAASILFIALIVSYLWYQYDVLIGPPTLVLASPSADLEVHDSELKVQGRTDGDVYLTINGQDVYVNQDGTFATTISLAAGINAVEIKAKNHLGKETTLVRQILYKTNLPVGQAGQQPASQSGQSAGQTAPSVQGIPNNNQQN